MNLTSRVRRIEARVFGARAWSLGDQEECMRCMEHYERTGRLPEGANSRAALVAAQVMETAKLMDHMMGGGHHDHWPPMPDEGYVRMPTEGEEHSGDRGDVRVPSPG